MNTRAQHWNAVYGAKTPTSVSWYQPHLTKSFSLIRSSPLGKQAHVIDVGGGASTLVDDLLDEDFPHVTVLDLSSKALEQAKARLGDRAGRVIWIDSDIVNALLPKQAYDVWHDRAVFHFLTAEEDRRKYLEHMRQALRPDGRVIVATFSLAGPPTCSGLDVVRYSPETLAREFGEGFTLLDSDTEIHQTPFGATQDFVYCRFIVKSGTGTN